jgi:hypothetical protein
MKRPFHLKLGLRTLVPSTFLALAALAVPVTAGCGAGSPDENERVAQGSVSMPLVTTTNGNVYRLNNAWILICGFQCTSLTSSDDPNETKLSAQLETGTYQANLQSWTLEKRDADGVFHPVQATLISNPWPSFQIYDGATTTVSFQFQTDGVIVTVGEGSVNVTVDVTETPPVCTALGSECGEGSWCPPPELTGTFPACLLAGSIEVGQPCSDPTSCVANASCFDIGSGPVCLALCPASEFGLPCPSGGACEPAGNEFGICR